MIPCPGIPGTVCLDDSLCDGGRACAAGKRAYIGKFALKDCVIIDGDESLKAYVTGVQFRSVRDPLYEVSYMTGGVNQSPWIEEYRLCLKS